MTIFVFVLAVMGGVILGIAGNAARRLKNTRLVILVGSGAALTFVTFALSNGYLEWLSPSYAFMLGLVIGTVLLDRPPFAFSRPSSQQDSDSEHIERQ